ncbi:flagellar hook-length control protein FliK [Bremerella sp. P1]|uniref:flagellar hook-length control protein FliK n=1 Tax=Bremerella sp. P1 TaxID=3026424 RepID=UPI0023688D81|nr:flagellar hook-length control protein FliK [Bremerella sp. P1]WDI43040.1 flagellar hook-length control protein FliK [Bremerella sp. P1]
MEPSSSNSVNPTPGWSGGTRNNSAPAADPMAFFDLIMKSSQAMASKGSKPFDPVVSTGTTAVANDPYTAPTDDPNLHDGYDDSSASYTSEAPTRETSNVDPPADSPTDQDDTAAVVDFSEQPSAREEESGEPNQAALETAAAATQQEQLLSAPDTLADTEQAEAEEQAPDEVIRSSGEKKEAPLPGEVDTDQPLDTTKASEEPSNEQHDSAAETTIQSVRRKSKESDEQTFAAAEEVAVEGVDTNPGEETSEVHSHDKGKLKLESVEQVADETSETTVDLETEDQAGDRSFDRKPKNTSSQRAENNKAKSVDIVEPTQTTAPDTSTVAAVAKASEALAAAASGSAVPASSSAGSSASNNTTGVNNLASLLQRGFQRGTLQKSEGSQAPKLDPKQQIRLINRVARAVETTPPGQSIKIRLNPSELGQLKVEIKIENGNMTAKIEAENAATRQVLLENLPQLRERLAESNINVQQFEVELMGQQTPQDGSASTFADQSEGQSGSQTSSRQGVESSSEEESPSGPRETVNKDAERDSRNLNVTI